MANLCVYYQNTRGIRTKCLDFRQNLLCNNYDLVIVTETWLQNDIFDREFCDDRYDVFRKDRNLAVCNKKAGGGVLILAKRELCAMRISDISIDASTDLLTITIPAQTTSSSAHLTISAVYIPPDTQQIPLQIDFILRYMESLCNLYPNHHQLLIGDFNLPCISWDVNGPVHIRQGNSDVQHSGVCLLDELCFLGLTQYNTIKNYAGNTLDLAFSNLPLSIQECTQSLSKLDKAHPSFSVEIHDLRINPLKESSALRHNFHKGDYVNLNKYFQEYNWHTLTSCGTEEATKTLYEILNGAIMLYVPFVNAKRKMYPVWYSAALIKIIKEKYKAHMRWKKFNNKLDYDEFALLRDRQRRVQNECFKNYTVGIESAIAHNPKMFWSYIKSQRGGSSYPKTMTYGNNTYTEGKQICDAFNRFFQSVFGVRSDGNFCTTNYNYTSYDDISKIVINADTLKKFLMSLDVTKGPGSDGIPPIFWRNCAESLAVPIAALFNISLQEYIFPSKWKEAHIVPIYKKGSKTNIENYRGISILNTIGKVFEKIVYNSIYPIIVKGVPNNQHGFLGKRSTVTNLACFANYVLPNMDRGGQVDVIYTDFEKAFDRVDHVILLRKLQDLGIHGDLLRWIESYLSNRSQAVVVGGYRSDFINVPTGVPQGSHLGPLFYNTYIYDITKSIEHAQCLLYADDKKVFLKTNNINDCGVLQSDLDHLYQYYKDNNISVNVKKCQCISFTRKRKPLNFAYNFNGTNIDRTHIVRDLGIHFDSKMLLSHHINSIAEKAFINLGFVIRSCKPFTDTKALKIVFCAFVRSTLEYASSIWCPQYQVYKERLERIQLKFIKHLNYRRRDFSISYVDDCHKYGLMTLEQRRQLLDASLLYDIVCGRVDCPELVASVSYCAPVRRTRHTPLFHVPRLSTNYAANAPAARLPGVYNDTFSDIDPFVYSKQSFKKHATKILKN